MYFLLRTGNSFSVVNLTCAHFLFNDPGNREQSPEAGSEHGTLSFSRHLSQLCSASRSSSANSDDLNSCSAQAGCWDGNLIVGPIFRYYNKNFPSLCSTAEQSSFDIFKSGTSSRPATE